MVFQWKIVFFDLLLQSYGENNSAADDGDDVKLDNVINCNYFP